jgi:hypothetical protein
MFGFGSGLGTIGKNAANTASNVGAGYGADASTVNSQLLPFLTRELNNPMGYSQQQKGAMLGGAEAGAGGVAAGLNTEADLAAARNRNSGSFSGALDEAARDRGKTLSGISSGIEAKNADLQQQQQQSAASGLTNLYGMDTNAQLKSMGLVPQDINAANAANMAPWENLTKLITGTGQAAATAYAGR